MAEWLELGAPPFSPAWTAGPANVTGLPQWSAADPMVCGGRGGGGDNAVHSSGSGRCIADGNHCFGPDGSVSDFKSIPISMW